MKKMFIISVSQLVKKYKPTNLPTLDVGCSEGKLTLFLKESFPKIIGLDPDKKAIEIAKKRKLNAKHYDGDKIPFKDNSFDILLNISVIEHAEDPLGLVKEMNRVLKKDGVLYLEVANKYFPIEPHFYLPFLSYLPKKLANIYLKLSGQGEGYDDINLVSYKEIMNLLKKSNFKVMDHTLDLIENYEEYQMDLDNPFIIRTVSKIIKLNKKLKLNFLNKMLLRISLGWVIIAKPVK